MSLSLIVAVAENDVIGRDGGLPWRLSRDLKRFKKRTWGHTLLMGRKTWDSIGRPLPGRRSIVLTRQQDFSADGAQTASSLEQALQMAGEEDVFVIGGAEIYRQALPLAEHLFLTRVHAEVEGDVLFPSVDWSQWRRLEEERFEADDRHEYPHSFLGFERVSR